MALTDLYLVTTKNLGAFFTTLHSAQAPIQFTIKFLESLDFKSTNDRLFLKLLKELAMLDSTGKPTQRYYDFLDQSQSKVVLAKAIKEAYSDLFQIDKNANKLPVAQVKNKLKTLTQGKKSEKVYSLMANTFVDLCKQADFATPESNIIEVKDEAEQPLELDTAPDANSGTQMPSPSKINTNLHYNIQIHLPDTRDAAVFDSIFSSLKKHLL